MNKQLVYGFWVFEPTTFERSWCRECTKSRVHEHYQGWTMCTYCGKKEEPENETPVFQIERFIKEGV